MNLQPCGVLHLNNKRGGRNTGWQGLIWSPYQLPNWLGDSYKQPRGCFTACMRPKPSWQPHDATVVLLGDAEGAAALVPSPGLAVAGFTPLGKLTSESVEVLAMPEVTDATAHTWVSEGGAFTVRREKGSSLDIVLQDLAHAAVRVVPWQQGGRRLRGSPAKKPCQEDDEELPAATAKSMTRLPSGLVIEMPTAVWSWKRVFVADDGRALLALSSRNGAPDLWMWSTYQELADLDGTTQVPGTWQHLARLHLPTESPDAAAAAPKDGDENEQPALQQALHARFVSHPSLGARVAVAAALWGPDLAGDVGVHVLLQPLHPALPAEGKADVAQWRQNTFLLKEAPPFEATPAPPTQAVTTVVVPARNKRFSKTESFEDLDLEQPTDEWRRDLKFQGGLGAHLPPGSSTITATLLAWHSSGQWLAVGISTLQDFAWLLILTADLTTCIKVPWKEVISSGEGRGGGSTPGARDESTAILRSLTWLPHPAACGPVLTAMDKWGNVALLDLQGNVQKLQFAWTHQIMGPTDSKAVSRTASNNISRTASHDVSRAASHNVSRASLSSFTARLTPRKHDEIVECLAYNTWAGGHARTGHRRFSLCAFPASNGFQQCLALSDGQQMATWAVKPPLLSVPRSILTPAVLVPDALHAALEAVQRGGGTLARDGPEAAALAQLLGQNQHLLQALDRMRIPDRPVLRELQANAGASLISGPHLHSLVWLVRATQDCGLPADASPMGPLDEELPDSLGKDKAAVWRDTVLALLRMAAEPSSDGSVASSLQALLQFAGELGPPLDWRGLQDAADRAADLPDLASTALAAGDEALLRGNAAEAIAGYREAGAHGWLPLMGLYIHLNRLGEAERLLRACMASAMTTIRSTRGRDHGSAADLDAETVSAAALQLALHVGGLCAQLLRLEAPQAGKAHLSAATQQGNWEFPAPSAWRANVDSLEAVRTLPLDPLKLQLASRAGGPAGMWQASVAVGLLLHAQQLQGGLAGVQLWEEVGQWKHALRLAAACATAALEVKPLSAAPFQDVAVTILERQLEVSARLPPEAASPAICSILEASRGLDACCGRHLGSSVFVACAQAACGQLAAACTARVGRLSVVAASGVEVEGPLLQQLLKLMGRVMWQTFMASEGRVRVYTPINRERLALALSRQAGLLHLLRLAEQACSRAGLAAGFLSALAEVRSHAKRNDFAWHSFMQVLSESLKEAALLSEAEWLQLMDGCSCCAAGEPAGPAAVAEANLQADIAILVRGLAGIAKPHLAALLKTGWAKRLASESPALHPVVSPATDDSPHESAQAIASRALGLATRTSWLLICRAQLALAVRHNLEAVQGAMLAKEAQVAAKETAAGKDIVCWAGALAAADAVHPLAEVHASVVGACSSLRNPTIDLSQQLAAQLEHPPIDRARSMLQRLKAAAADAPHSSVSPDDVTIAVDETSANSAKSKSSHVQKPIWHAEWHKHVLATEALLRNWSVEETEMPSLAQATEKAAAQDAKAKPLPVRSVADPLAWAISSGAADMMAGQDTAGLPSLAHCFQHPICAGLGGEDTERSTSAALLSLLGYREREEVMIWEAERLAWVEEQTQQLEPIVDEPAGLPSPHMCLLALPLHTPRAAPTPASTPALHTLDMLAPPVTPAQARSPQSRASSLTATPKPAHRASLPILASPHGRDDMPHTASTPSGLIMTPVADAPSPTADAGRLIRAFTPQADGLAFGPEHAALDKPAGAKRHVAFQDSVAPATQELQDIDLEQPPGSAPVKADSDAMALAPVTRHLPAIKVPNTGAGKPAGYWLPGGPVCEAVCRVRPSNMAALAPGWWLADSPPASWADAQDLQESMADLAAFEQATSQSMFFRWGPGDEIPPLGPVAESWEQAPHTGAAGTAAGPSADSTLDGGALDSAWLLEWSTDSASSLQPPQLGSHDHAAAPPQQTWAGALLQSLRPRSPPNGLASLHAAGSSRPPPSSPTNGCVARRAALSRPAEAGPAGGSGSRPPGQAPGPLAEATEPEAADGGSGLHSLPEQPGTPSRSSSGKSTEAHQLRLAALHVGDVTEEPPVYSPLANNMRRVSSILTSGELSPHRLLSHSPSRYTSDHLDTASGSVAAQDWNDSNAAAVDDQQGSVGMAEPQPAPGQMVQGEFSFGDMLDGGRPGPTKDQSGPHMPPESSPPIQALRPPMDTVELTPDMAFASALAGSAPSQPASPGSSASQSAGAISPGAVPQSLPAGTRTGCLESAGSGCLSESRLPSAASLPGPPDDASQRQARPSLSMLSALHKGSPHVSVSVARSSAAHARSPPSPPGIPAPSLPLPPDVGTAPSPPPAQRPEAGPSTLQEAPDWGAGLLKQQPAGQSSTNILELWAPARLAGHTERQGAAALPAHHVDMPPSLPQLAAHSVGQMLRQMRLHATAGPAPGLFDGEAVEGGEDASADGALGPREAGDQLEELDGVGDLSELCSLNISRQQGQESGADTGARGCSRRFECGAAGQSQFTGAPVLPRPLCTAGHHGRHLRLMRLQPAGKENAQRWADGLAGIHTSRMQACPGRTRHSKGPHPQAAYGPTRLLHPADGTPQIRLLRVRLERPWSRQASRQSPSPMQPASPAHPVPGPATISPLSHTIHIGSISHAVVTAGGWDPRFTAHDIFRGSSELLDKMRSIMHLGPGASQQEVLAALAQRGQAGGKTGTVQHHDAATSPPDELEHGAADAGRAATPGSVERVKVVDMHSVDLAHAPARDKAGARLEIYVGGDAWRSSMRADHTSKEQTGRERLRMRPAGNRATPASISPTTYEDEIRYTHDHQSGSFERADATVYDTSLGRQCVDPEQVTANLVRQMESALTLSTGPEPEAFEAGNNGSSVHLFSPGPGVRQHARVIPQPEPVKTSDHDIQLDCYEQTLCGEPDPARKFQEQHAAVAEFAAAPTLGPHAAAARRLELEHLRRHQQGRRQASLVKLAARSRSASPNDDMERQSHVQRGEAAADAAGAAGPLQAEVVAGSREQAGGAQAAATREQLHGLEAMPADMVAAESWPAMPVAVPSPMFDEVKAPAQQLDRSDDGETQPSAPRHHSAPPASQTGGLPLPAALESTHALAEQTQASAGGPANSGASSPRSPALSRRQSENAAELAAHLIASVSQAATGAGSGSPATDAAGNVLGAADWEAALQQQLDAAAGPTTQQFLQVAELRAPTAPDGPNTQEAAWTSLSHKKQHRQQVARLSLSSILAPANQVRAKAQRLREPAGAQPSGNAFADTIKARHDESGLTSSASLGSPLTSLRRQPTTAQGWDIRPHGHKPGSPLRGQQTSGTATAKPAMSPESGQLKHEPFGSQGWQSQAPLLAEGSWASVASQATTLHRQPTRMPGRDLQSQDRASHATLASQPSSSQLQRQPTNAQGWDVRSHGQERGMFSSTVSPTKSGLHRQASGWALHQTGSGVGQGLATSASPLQPASRQASVLDGKRKRRDSGAAGGPERMAQFVAQARADQEMQAQIVKAQAARQAAEAHAARARSLAGQAAERYSSVRQRRLQAELGDLLQALEGVEKLAGEVEGATAASRQAAEEVELKQRQENAAFLQDALAKTRQLSREIDGHQESLDHMRSTYLAPH